MTAQHSRPCSCCGNNGHDDHVEEPLDPPFEKNKHNAYTFDPDKENEQLASCPGVILPKYDRLQYSTSNQYVCVQVHGVISLAIVESQWTSTVLLDFILVIVIIIIIIMDR